MAAALNTASPPLSEINITPLVDVMLVLLVIFMVTAPTLSNRLALKLPQSVDNTPVPIEPIRLSISADDIYRLDGVAVTRDELRAVLLQAATNQAKTTVKIEVASDLDYQAAMTAMAIVRQAGVEHFSIDVN